MRVDRDGTRGKGPHGETREIAKDESTKNREQKDAPKWL